MASQEQFTCKIKPNPPFRLDFTVWALRRKSENIVDRWDGVTYRRVIMADSRPVELAVTQDGSAASPTLNVNVNGDRSQREPDVRNIVSQLLGVNVDLSQFYAIARLEPRIGPLVEKFTGVKPPRFLSVFEALVNGIACQKVSLNVGMLLLNRLAIAHGPRFKNDDETTYGFPRPEDLIETRPRRLRRLGFSMQKSRAVIEISRMIVHNRLDLTSLDSQGDEELIQQLSELPSVGRWTAEYTLLRGMGRVNVFPADDVGARNRLRVVLKLRRKLDYDVVKRILNRWGPYSGLLYFHMLLEGLATDGQF